MKEIFSVLLFGTGGTVDARATDAELYERIPTMLAC